MRLTHAALGPMLGARARPHRQRRLGRRRSSRARPTARARAGSISFSRWANGRYAPRGVTVTAVCPGFTHTNFHERMGLPPGEEGVAGVDVARRARDVVSEALRDVARGKAVSIPSLRYKALVALTRIAAARALVDRGGRRRGRR